jgi:hypothetical membrane protein
MKVFRPAKLYSQRYPRLGPLLYVSSTQYFLAQILVAREWPRPYSIAHDTISDLGNTSCGVYNNARFVCSPLHSVMNASFALLGIAMALGSLLILRQSSDNRRAALGLILMTISGIGVIMVGIFPENSVPVLHGTGAALPFVLGNAGVIVLGSSLSLPAPLRLYSFLSGGVAIIALGIYESSHYLGLGEGGMERIVAYPQTAWLIVVGVYILRRNPLPRRRRPVRGRSPKPIHPAPEGTAQEQDQGHPGTEDRAPDPREVQS